MQYFGLITRVILIASVCSQIRVYDTPNSQRFMIATGRTNGCRRFGFNLQNDDERIGIPQESFFFGGGGVAGLRVRGEGNCF